MLGHAVLTTMVPVTDLARARQFYGKALGLRTVDDNPFSTTFEAGSGSRLLVYLRGPSTADHTLGFFDVTDLVQLVADLGSRGVPFEQYDTPMIRTINFIAEEGPRRHAWFRDPDGNIFELIERGWTGAMG